MHAGMVVGIEADGLGTTADVLAESACGSRWCHRPRSHHRSRQDSANGRNSDHLLEHGNRLNFLMRAECAPSSARSGMGSQLNLQQTPSKPYG